MRAGNLYVTWDKIGSDTGGGTVTCNELLALQEVDETDVINPPMTCNPFDADDISLEAYKQLNKKYKIAHFYSSSYPRLVKALKEDDTKVTYTCAAHDPKASQKEFEKLGWTFDLPHLTDPKLFNKYLEAYQNADLIICPSKHSRNVLDKLGCCTPVKVIPHGHNPVQARPIDDLPFAVGYLGACGPDKGLIYLIQAWAELNYQDAQLIMAGRNQEVLLPLIRQYGKGSIHLMGCVKSISSLFDACTVYVQPSVTEGFGIEVLEAMSCGRPVVATTGVGALNCVSTFSAHTCDPSSLADKIDYYKKNREVMLAHGRKLQEESKKYTWDKIRQQYVDAWRQL